MPSSDSCLVWPACCPQLEPCAVRPPASLDVVILEAPIVSNLLLSALACNHYNVLRFPSVPISGAYCCGLLAFMKQPLTHSCFLCVHGRIFLEGGGAIKRNRGSGGGLASCNSDLSCLFRHKARAIIWSCTLTSGAPMVLYTSFSI